MTSSSINIANTAHSRRSVRADSFDAMASFGLRGERGVEKLTGAASFWELLQASAAEGVLQHTGAVSVVADPKTVTPSKANHSNGAEKSQSLEAAKRLEGERGPTDEVHLKTPIKADDERFFEWMLEAASVQTTLNGTMPNGVLGWQPLLAQLPLQWGQPSDDGGGGASSIASTLGDSVTAWLKGDAMRGKTLRVSLAGQADLILKIHAGKVQAQFVGYEAGMMPLLQQTSRDLQQHLASKQLPVEAITWRDESRQPHQGHQSEQSSQPDDSLNEQEVG